MLQGHSRTLWVSGRLLLLFALVCGLGAPRAAGQAATANIQGIVTDATGAAVPDATIQLRNVNTGATQSTTTNNQGRYNVPNLGVGEYEIRASKSGFTTLVRTGVTLAVGAQAVADLTLQVGQQAQTVTVEAQVSQVETTDAAVGALVDQTQMRELPLNGRNFEQLIVLTPGVQSMGGNAFLASGFQGRAVQYSIAGSRPTGQAILLDDENLQNYWNKGMGSVTGSSLGMEAIGEFETLTNTYSARFGGNGAVVNAVSKSGTNALHGSAYEFFRNDALDAFNTFAKKGASPIKPALRQNQFGGSLAGPIKKDKMFFFVNYEGIRRTAGDTRIANVPGCNLTPSACVPSFPRATNPTSFDAIVSTLAVFPAANQVVNGQPQALSVASGTAREHYLLSRFDYSISDKDAVFVRYISDKSELTDPFGGGGFAGGPIPFWPEQDFSHMHFATAEWRRIISPTLVNVARVSFSRPATDEFTGKTAPGGLVNGTDPLQFFPGTGRQDGITAIGGLNGIGGALQLPFNTTQNRFTESDDITWTHGAHTVRVGASISRLQSNTFMPFFQGAQWNFFSLADFLGNRPGVVVFVPLNVASGPLAGQPSYPNRDFRHVEFTPYAQDDWKVTSKLTLNMGLRWEYVTNPTDKHNQLFWVPNIDTAGANGAFPWTNVEHVMASNPSWKNFNPRFGFAYDPFSDHKTSIRGGFGMFHEIISVQNYSPGYWAAYPWATALGLPLPFLPPLNYPTIPPAIISQASAFPGWDYFTNNTPYMMQYNLNVQRELAQGTVLTVGYIGSHGVHLFTGQEQNPPTVCSFAEGPGCSNPTYAKGFAGGYLGTGTPGNVTGNPRRNPIIGAFPNLNANSTSRYNSLQVSVNRRFSSNVQGQANYTWSRCIDDGGYLGSFNTASTGNYTNPYNRAFDRSVCSHDVTHTFRLSGLYMLPFKGNALVSGWQVSGIVSANSGLPYNIADGYDEVSGGSGPGALNPHPNYTAGCKADLGSVDKWFDPNCFTLQAPGTFGNLGRNTGRGPSLANLDVAFLKDTKIREMWNVQFRAEFFNIFNHVNYGLPSAGLGGGAQLFTGGGTRIPNAGQITSIVGTPRQIQFALKLTF